MVYIIRCERPRKDSELETMRAKFKQQIREGVLLLPVDCQLREVVKDASQIDVEFPAEDYTRLVKVLEDIPDGEKCGSCRDCAHCKDETPSGATIHTDTGWCEVRKRFVARIAGCYTHFKNKEENEND